MSYIERIAKERKLPVKDATRPLVIGVSVDGIKKAQKKDSRCCAFSRAAMREPNVVGAHFFRTTAYLEYRNELVRYALPPSVQKEIVSFDRCGIIAPGTYQLSSVPPANTKAGARIKTKKSAEKRRVERAQLAEIVQNSRFAIGAKIANMRSPVVGAARLDAAFRTPKAGTAVVALKTIRKPSPKSIIRATQYIRTVER